MIKIKIKQLLITVLLLCFLTSLVTAEITTDENDLTFSVNYESLEDNDDELSIEQKVTLTNSGEVAENLTISFERNSDYDVDVEESLLQLSASSSADITIKGTIPVNVDQGQEEIGKLKITDSTETKEYSVYIDVKSMLEIKKIKVIVNGDEEKTIDEDNEEIKNLNPGDKIELRFQLENLFDEDYDDGEIDGEIAIKLDNSDFGDDVDEEEEFFIEAGEKLTSNDEEIVLSFDVPMDAEDEDYQLEVEIEGKDDNKAKYQETWTINLEIERENDDVRVDLFTISPSEVSCSREVKFVTKVVNYGKNRQKHAALSIYNTNLDLDIHENFLLERGTNDDNEYFKEVLVDISDDVMAGTYLISATAYYDYSTYSDKQNVNLIVKECSTSADDNQGPTSSDDTSNNSETSGQSTAKDTESAASKLTSSNIVKTVEDPYTSYDLMIAAIIIAIILVLAIISLFILLLIKN